MHEYGIALEIAETVFQTAGERHISNINLRIGDLSGVFSDSLTMYLELIFQEKQDRSPVISVEKVGAKFKCSCEIEYSPAKIFDPCPSCGGFDRVVVDGNQCTLESIEVEDG
ncbi:MAG: hydrogenase maturation nickel metallochaperone HypA [Chitinispirillaceae bacterium]|jgi:Zn finger protein HypA/HybF involved in hydrogenase expression